MHCRIHTHIHMYIALNANVGTCVELLLIRPRATFCCSALLYGYIHSYTYIYEVRMVNFICTPEKKRQLLWLRLYSFDESLITQNEFQAFIIFRTHICVHMVKCTHIHIRLDRIGIIQIFVIGESFLYNSISKCDISIQRNFCDPVNFYDLKILPKGSCKRWE